MDVAWEAYQKVQQLDEKGKFPKKLKVQFENLAIDYANKGVEFYSSENYAGALNAFKRVLEIEKSPIINNPGIDTAIIFNAGLAAQKANLLSEAEGYYKEALKYNYEPAKTNVMLASVLKEQGKKEEALQYLQKGYELAPNDPFTLVELINYYLLGGEPEKLKYIWMLQSNKILIILLIIGLKVLCMRNLTNRKKHRLCMKRLCLSIRTISIHCFI